jgi:hypothetical protein
VRIHNRETCTAMLIATLFIIYSVFVYQQMNVKKIWYIPIKCNSTIRQNGILLFWKKVNEAWDHHAEKDKSTSETQIPHFHSFANLDLKVIIWHDWKRGLFRIEGISVLIESFLIYVKIHLTIEEWIYVWVYSIPLASILVFTPMPHSFDYCSFVVSFEIRKCSPPFFLFKDCFGILKFLVIPHTFHMDFLILSGITLNL